MPPSFEAMPVSDWVPIASVIATAAVGLGVPIITARYDRGRIRAQAEEGRLDELRGVIDEAGASIAAVGLALEEAGTEASRDLAPPDPTGTGFSLDEFIEHERPALFQFSERLEAVWRYENRLAVRVTPEDDIYNTFSAALGPLSDALLLLELAARGEEPFTDTGRRLVSDIRGDVLTAQREFYRSAAKRIGIPAADERKRRLIRRTSMEG